MTTPLDVLEAEVLSLPPDLRFKLLDRIFASLDTVPEVEAVWAREAERRDDELRSGAVAGIPLDEVLTQLRTPSE